MTNLFLFFVPFYLKRHHSICIDIILDMAVNVIEMTARDVIAAITFFAFDTNGTILVAGVFERVMQDVSHFRSSVNSHGMYQALAMIVKQIGHDHGSKISGCSEGPRYIYPVERSPMEKDVSDTFVCKAIELCNQLRTQVSFLDKTDYSNFKDFKSCLPKGCSAAQYKKEYIDSRCKSFLKDISSAAGKGVGHMLSLTFFQLSSLLGILPLSLYSWAMVCKGSGGYHYINSICTQNGKKNPSIRTVNDWIMECTSELSSSVSPNVNLGLIENMLCEFKREEQSRSSKSNKKDYLFFMQHRGSWQNLYRLEFKSPTKASLYIRPSTDNNYVFKNKLASEIGTWTILSKDKLCNKKGKDGAFLCWVNTNSSVEPNNLHLDHSKVHVSDGLANCFKSRC